VLAVILRLALFVINEPYVEGDTQLLVKSVGAIRACLSEGRFVGCNFHVPFPLLQYVPSIILSYPGFSESAILHFLAYLSFLAFLAAIALIFLTLKKRASMEIAVCAALIMLTGPLLWYSHSTYGEMLAAFLILAFTVGSLLRIENRYLIPLFVLAGVTKEIAFPFLLLIGCLGLLPEIVTAPRKIRGRLYGLLAGAALSVFVNGAFNYFRYGTFYGEGYLNKLFIVPTFKLQLSFFLAIWFAPNGGLLFFWPTFVLLYFSVLLLLFVGRKKKMRAAELEQEPYGRLIVYLPISVVSLVLILLTAGFSRWYTPLGGAAWGPRFMLLWIPTVTLLLLYFYAQEVTTILWLILSKTSKLALVCAALVIASLPQLMVLFDPFVLARLFAQTPECPRLPMIQEDVVYYYRCIQAQMWRGNGALLESFPVALRPNAFVFAVLYGVMLAGACMWIRKGLVENSLSVETGVPMVEEDREDSNVEAETLKVVQRPARHWLGVLLFFSLLYVIFFSPVLFRGGLLLAPGDGLPLNLPNFLSRKVLWDILLFGGYPMFADPQVMMWYPPSRLLSHIPGSWNFLVLSAYILASFSMYGYVYTVTRSRLSALTSGMIYGMSGFMMAHLGHTGIIHAVAWLPLIIWSLEMLRRKWSPLWLATGSLAVGFCFLAGQSQIFFYSLLLSVCYAIALGWSAPVGRRSFYPYALLLVGLGIGLAAIQLIPTAELVNQSVRREFSFTDFVTFSMPVNQLITLIFPYLYGASERPGHPYFGIGNSTETAAYVGLLSVMLAVTGFAAARRRRLTVFWGVVILFSLLLALGYATPLARLMYYVPVMNRFRVPARHFLEMTFAVSVLAGLGVSAIRRGQVSLGLIRKTILVSSLVMFACLLMITVKNAFSDQLVADAASIAGVRDLDLLPWANSVVGVPLLVFLLGAAALAYWCVKPRSAARTRLFLLVLFIDLASFGWFYEWSYGSPDKSNLSPPAVAQDLTSALNTTHQRFLPVDGYLGFPDNLPPDLSRMWGVPSASGYNVLRLERVSRLLLLYEGGNVEPSWSDPDNQSVNVIATRYIFAPRGEFMSKGGVSWLGRDLNLWTGEGCGHDSTPSLTFDIPKPFKATRVGLVSMLSCSTGVSDGTEVARLSVTDASGRVQTQSIVAGRDSSEWAYDCSNIPTLQHKRASIFKNYPAKMFDAPCEGHHYVTMLNLDEATNIKSVSLQWTGGNGGLIVQKVSLIDGSTDASYPVNPEYLDSNHYRLVDETDRVRLYENLRAMPRVWLAHEMALVNPEEALQTIKTSKLPDGSDFDPARTALVEEALSLPSQERDPNAVAEVLSLSDNAMEVRTSSASPAILVTSDAYYPGWKVSIDGQNARLFRADYAIRGVWLPAGQHVVRFQFRPRSFYYGATISAISLLALLVIFSRALILTARRKRVLDH
jgi:hypothetical protein